MIQLQEMKIQQYTNLENKKCKAKVAENTNLNTSKNNHNLCTPNAGLMKVYFAGKKKDLAFGGTQTNYLVHTPRGYIEFIVEPGVDLTKWTALPGLICEGGDWTGAKLKDAYLKGSKLPKSNFTKANMDHVRLHESDLKDSNFQNAYCFRAVFKDSDLSRANFKEANLKRANFQNTILKDANLSNANLTYCNLIGADLRGVTTNDNTIFDYAVYDDTTKFPEGFDPEYKDMIKFEKGADFTGYFRTFLQGVYVKPSGYPYGDMINSDFRNVAMDDVSFETVDFSDSNFEGAQMKKAEFRDCPMFNCKFNEDSDLREANFQGCRFEGSRFNGANLSGANLIGSLLDDTDIASLPSWKLRDAIYDYTTEFPADFAPKAKMMKEFKRGSDMSGANLSRIHIRGEDLVDDDANYEGTIFKRADLKRSLLNGVNFKKADFEKAYLREADLTKSNFEEANFLGANLQGANLSQANFKNADFRWARLEGAIIDEKTNFTGAKYNISTRFPQGFDPEKHGMIEIKPKMAE